MTCHFQCSKDIEAWCWSDPRPAERTDDLSGRERFAEFRIGGLPAREQPRTWCNPAAMAAATPGARDPVGGAHVNQSEHWLCRRQGRATDQPVVSGHRHIREQPNLFGRVVARPQRIHRVQQWQHRDALGGRQHRALQQHGGDSNTIGAVFTYNASTGQYTNAVYGNLANLTYTASTNTNDSTSISIFATKPIRSPDTDSLRGRC
jgi:hypothetical protein